MELSSDESCCSTGNNQARDQAGITHSCIGEGNGNPLQCSCLENPRDGGAWWAAVYGVAQSRTLLKRLSSSSSSKHCLGAGDTEVNLTKKVLLWLSLSLPAPASLPLLSLSVFFLLLLFYGPASHCTLSRTQEAPRPMRKPAETLLTDPQRHSFAV